MSHGIFIGAGSNLGNRVENLVQACLLLDLRVVQESSVYETEPVGYLDQPWFLNKVIQVETDLRPQDLLLRCQDVENRLGRIRKIHQGPRSIDLDLLFYNDLILNESDLVLPHPAIQFRKFVLIPLLDIAPQFMHPLLQKSVTDLLASCNDTSEVRRL